MTGRRSFHTIILRVILCAVLTLSGAAQAQNQDSNPARAQNQAQEQNQERISRGNRASDWIPIENLPEGAQILDRKWIVTRVTETDSGRDSLSGFASAGANWILKSTGVQTIAAFPAGFDQSHELYQTMAQSAPEAFENETTRRTVSMRPGGYIYWH